MCTPLLAVALLLSAAQAPSITSAASTIIPGVAWRPDSVLTADFSCRGHKEQALLGVTPKETVIAVFLNDGTARPEVLRYSAEARDAKEIKLTIESLDFDPGDEIGDLPGFRRSRTCKGLNLSDGKVDSVHIYWNHDAKHVDDWVR